MCICVPQCVCVGQRIICWSLFSLTYGPQGLRFYGKHPNMLNDMANLNS